MMFYIFAFISALANVLLAIWILSPHEASGERSNLVKWANFGVTSSVTQLLITFTYYLWSPEVQTSMMIVCLSIWVLTILLMLYCMKWPFGIRSILGGYILLGALIIMFYPGGAEKFLSQFDGFIQSTVGGSPNLKVDGESNTEGVPVVTLCRALFFFSNAFIVMSFYGSCYIRSGYIDDKGKPEAVSRTAGFERESVNQIIYVVSFIFAMIISFIIAGGDVIGVSVFSGFAMFSLSVVFRDLLTNFVSGLLLLWDNSIRVGDVIAINGGYGWVIGITMRYIIIKDRDDITTLIPHSKLLNGEIENWSRGDRMVRQKLVFSVAYGTDIQKMREIVLRASARVPRVLKTPAPRLLIMGLDDSALRFELRFRINDPENGIPNVKSALYEQILSDFKDEKIEIPFPQRSLLFPEKLNVSLNTEHRNGELEDYDLSLNEDPVSH